MFILPQFQYSRWQTITISAPSSIVYDTYFRYTSLLINADNVSTGTQNITFKDGSTNNFTISTVGTPTQTSLTPFYPNGWSGYFDGAGRLIYTTNASLSYGTGPYTIEAWVYPTANNSYIYTQCVGGTNYLIFGINSNSQLHMFSVPSGGGTSLIALSSYIQLNRWTHVALVRENTGTNGVKFYQDGILVGAVTNATDLSNITTVLPAIGGYQHTTGSEFNGYISNLRITKGQALYTGTFTPSVSALTINSIGSTGSGVAASLSGTVGLLALQNNKFVDNSVSAKTASVAGTITPQIAPTAPFSKYTNASYSGYFNGSTSYLSVPTSTDFAFSNGDFTIEAWIYTADTSFQIVAGTVQNQLGFGYNIDNGSQGLWLGRVGNALDVISNAQLTQNTWHHVAVTKASNSVKFFVDGTQVGNTSASSVTYTQGGLYIGRDYGVTAAFYYSGYISNLRIVKGQALYTSTFTPATAALTNSTVGATGSGAAASLSGTVALLTLQNATFIDNSLTAKSLTAVGTPIVTRNTPFFSDSGFSMATYSPSTHDGSVYFDGSSNLVIANSGQFDMNTSFTAEGWFYQLTTSASTGAGMGVGGGTAGWNATNGHEWILAPNFNGALNFQYLNGAVVRTIPATGATLKQWNHIAVGYSGTTVSVWLNGTRVINDSSVTVSLPTTRNIFRIGNIASSDSPFPGYISDLRIVRGTDVYGVSNTSITVPTGPLSVIANTSLLLRGNNGAIIDATGRNTITVASSARVDTTVRKFAPGSINFQTEGSAYFNGSSWLTINSSTPPLTAKLTSNLTIEFWAKRASGDGGVVMVLGDTNHGNTQWQVLESVGITFDTVSLTGNKIFLGGAFNSGNSFTLYFNDVVNDSWRHYAFVKNASNISVYTNGTLAASANITYTPNDIPGTYNGIGADWSGGAWGSPYKGYLSNMRILSGQALYTGNFTPLSTTLTNTTVGATGSGAAASLSGNVILLTFTNSLSDVSPSPKTLTKAGTPIFTSAQSLVGSYLKVLENDSIILKSGTPFTIEGWIYPTGDIQNRNILSKRTSGTISTISYALCALSGTGYLVFHNGTSGYNSSTALTISAWNHVAVTYDGSNLSMYKNGTIIYGPSAVAITNQTNSLYIGAAYPTSECFQGYMDDLRITKGVARYSGSSFTIPTSAFPTQ